MTVGPHPERSGGELERLGRLYSALAHTSHGIAHASDRDTLLAGACRSLVERGGFMMAWVGWHDPATRRLVPVASFGDEPGYLATIRVYADDRPEGTGPSGRAFRSRQPYVANDPLADPATAVFTESVKRWRLGSYAVFPIEVDDRPCATLSVYAAEPGFFRDEEVALLRTITMELSRALERQAMAAETREAEDTAARERRFAQTVLDSVPGVLYLYDENGKFLRWNRNFLDVTGYSAAEMKHLHPLDFFESPDRERVAARIGEVFLSGVSSVEANLRCKDGTLIPYHFTGRVVEVDGRTCLVGVGIDVSERARAIAALRESEERYHSTLDAVVEGCQLLDFEWRYLYLNDAASRHNRRPNAELLGRTMPECWPGIDQTEVFALFKRCMEQRTPGVMELQFTFPDGGTNWFEARVMPVPEGIFILSIDIEERKRAEAEMIRTTAKLREQAELLDKARDAIVVRDLEHRVRYWNRSAERLYGWSRDEIMDRPVSEVLYDNPAPFLAAVAEVMAKGEWSGEIEQKTRDGRKVTVEGHWTLVRDDAGLPASILAINTDVTQRKKLEQQFLRAQRLESIGTLAGGIAHDLNNVLAPIMLAVDFVASSVNDPDARESVDLIRTSARRGADMVAQVLSFARGMEGRRVVLNLTHPIRDLARVMRETFPKNITVETSFDADLWTMEGDPTQIHQVLLNLCVNARDAMPTGGSIRIAASNLAIDEHYASMHAEARVGPYVRLEVQDTGTGIPREVIDKIFDPFFTTKEVGKGTGLGLATTQAIVKGHGGFISVYSDPGAGTRFRVYFPATQGAVADAADAQAEAIPRGEGELILVVDDEASIRQITRQTLEAFGYRALVASDGSEAVSVFVQHLPDVRLVITDMMMPVMDGQATIQVLRRLKPGIPIIAASGIDASARTVKSLGANVAGVLTKPYTAEMLLKAIRAALIVPPPA
ncbi:MAG TPA: PAS domain S-box protein [Gemmatimonadaceae bacterium]|nr:PAS domain S-box protein [Gemmatimonadaceae bacterium]